MQPEIVRTTVSADRAQNERSEVASLGAKLVAELSREHANILRVLSVLEQHLRCVQEERAADYELAAAALQYVTHFVDRSHHLREDLAFEAVALRDPALNVTSSLLRAEHESLVQQGKHLELLLEEVVISDAPVSRERLCTQAFQYLEGLRAHIQREEETLFAALGEHLTEQDRERVSLALCPNDDPLFGRTIHSAYAALHDTLLSAG